MDRAVGCRRSLLQSTSRSRKGSVSNFRKMIGALFMLSICIVTYNNEDTIGKTLEALYTCMPENAKCRVYIVDNGSTDRTLEKLVPYLDRVKLIQSQKGNIGFSAATVSYTHLRAHET